MSEQTKKNVLVLIEVLLLLSTSLFVALTSISVKALDSFHVIEGNKIYVDTPEYYMSATPHTLGSSGYVTFELLSRDIEGKIDVVFGFEKDNIHVSNPQIWLNYSHLKSRMISFQWFNETSQEFETKYTTEDYEEWYFDWWNLDEKIKTEKIKWKQKNDWAYITQTIEKNVTYQYRFWIDIPFSGFKQLEGEWFFGFKDHSKSIKQTIEDGTLNILDPWYDSQWDYRIPITFNNSLATTNLSNFPVLIHLNDSNIDWTYVQNSGEDIRFTDSDEITLLNYEIELWNDTNDAYVWVNVPQIDLGSTTDLIYMYYNNSGASDGQNVEDTWDDNYVLVQHLQDDSGTQTDSTQYSNDGTLRPITYGQDTWVAGKLNNALEFDGANDFVLIPDSAELRFGTDDFTIELWFNCDSTPSQTLPTVVSKGASSSGQWYIRVERDANLLDFYFDQAYWTRLSYDFTDDAWYHIVLTRWGDNFTVYQDSVSVVNGSGVNNVDLNTANNLQIGARNGEKWWEGLADEVRIYNRAINSTEINTSYNSGNGANPLNSTGLAGWWKLDESIGLTASDSSGEGNVGTLYRFPSTLTTGIVDGALQFDQIDDDIYIADSDNLDLDGNDGSMTLECIVYFDTLPAFSHLISKHYVTYELVTKTTYPYTVVNNVVVASGIGGDLSTSAWYYIATTYTNTIGGRLFINGLNTTDTSATTTMQKKTNYLTIGSRTGGTLLGGIMDEVRISNVSRSTSWINATYLNLFELFNTFGSAQRQPVFIILYFDGGINLVYLNGSSKVNGSTTEYSPDTIANITSLVVDPYTFFKYLYGVTNTLNNPIFLTMIANQTVWVYSFREGATEGFMLATFLIILLVGVPMAVLLLRRRR